MQIKISNGNSKMGSIPSISLPAGLTCRSDCECIKKCYARRLERMRPSVRAAYQSNLDLLNRDSNTYWREVEASIMMSRFFRFHVSGDIPDIVYLTHIVEIAQKNPHCNILCFTKKYDIVNEWILTYGELPTNLHLVMSVWRGLECQNPYNLPEAHVRYRDGTTTARADAKECGGNCTECACTDDGCWTIQNGEQVVFNEH